MNLNPIVMIQIYHWLSHHVLMLLMFYSKVIWNFFYKKNYLLKAWNYLDLLQQTLDMHPNSNIIHIGCDEVMLTNSNSQCQEIKMSVSEKYIE